MPWLAGIRSSAAVFPQCEQTNTGRAASTSSRRRISVSQLCRPTRHASDLLMPEMLAMHSPWGHGQLRDIPACWRPSRMSKGILRINSPSLELTVKDASTTAQAIDPGRTAAANLGDSGPVRVGDEEVRRGLGRALAPRARTPGGPPRSIERRQSALNALDVSRANAGGLPLQAFATRRSASVPTR